MSSPKAGNDEGRGTDAGTLLLARSGVERLLDPVALLPELREAFRAYSLERTLPAQRARSPPPGSGGGSATLLFPGLVPGVPAYTVKVHAKFPGQRPAIFGLIHLHDLETGRLLAVMDSTLIIAVRIGLAGAVAADALARPDAGRVAIVGAGVQGEHQLRSLALVRRLERVAVFDLEPERAAVYARRMATELGVPVTAASSVAEAVAHVGIAVAATWASEPFLFEGMVRPGAHVTTLGPDEPGKVEVDAGLPRSALFVCDDREPAVEMGAAGGAGLGPEVVHAELGHVITGARPGRTGRDQVTVYGGWGWPSRTWSRPGGCTGRRDGSARGGSSTSSPDGRRPCGTAPSSTAPSPARPTRGA